MTTKNTEIAWFFKKLVKHIHYEGLLEKKL